MRMSSSTIVSRIRLSPFSKSNNLRSYSRILTQELHLKGFGVEPDSGSSQKIALHQHNVDIGPGRILAPSVFRIESFCQGGPMSKGGLALSRNFASGLFSTTPGQLRSPRLQASLVRKNFLLFAPSASRDCMLIRPARQNMDLLNLMMLYVRLYLSLPPLIARFLPTWNSHASEPFHRILPVVCH
jgi:hypothetical protein